MVDEDDHDVDDEGSGHDQDWDPDVVVSEQKIMSKHMIALQTSSESWDESFNWKIEFEKPSLPEFNLVHL